MYLHIVELLSNISSTFALARREFQTPDNTQRNTDVSFSLHQPPHLSLQPQLLHSGRCRCQKGAPRVRRGRRRQVPLPPIAQKSPYAAYFFVGNDYYLKLRVMHYLFFTAWTANKKNSYYVILLRNK